MENFITIFTPTYNRGYIINQLYQSLKRQTCKNFEWLVIDDGSSDNTGQLFRDILKENNDFNIRYYKVDNGGKHRTINKAVKLARGSHMFIVDSDDYLTSVSIKIVYGWLEEISYEDSFAGVSGLRGYDEHTPMGTTDCFKDIESLDKTNLEREEINLLADMAEIYRIDILKQFPFPEIDGEKFINESIVWDAIANEGYRIRWYNEIIYICKYLQGGLTKSGNKIYIENPKGYAMKRLQDIKFKKYRLKKRLIVYYEFYYDLKSVYDIKYISKLLKIPTLLLIFIIRYAERKS